MSKQKVLHAGWVIPVNPTEVVYKDHTLIIDDQKIAAILPTEKWYKRSAPKRIEEIDCRSMVLIPGFVNAHSHSPMSLLRGYAENLPLKKWLEEHIWPIEAALVDKDFVRDGTKLAVAEMLSSGTTCFNDMYFYGDETARVCIDTGIRASIGMIVILFPSSWATSVDEYFRKGQKIHDDFRSHPLISCTFAPHAPYSVDDDCLSRIATLSEEMDVQVHMHLHETKAEISESIKNYGISPIQRLARHGLLSPRLTAVHVTSIGDEELHLLARSGVNIVHCPRSNLKLGSGVAPILQMVESGLNVAIGTDSAASNNDLDMFGEMRTASLLAKGVNELPTALPASTSLKMATYNGAKAMGLADSIGSLEIGKFADIVALEIDQLGSAPTYDPIAQIVYNGHRDQIRGVWVAGRQLVKDGKLTTLEEEKLLERVRYWRDKIVGFKKQIEN